MSVVSGVLSGRGLCNGLIIRPEESYRLWCVVVCDIETPRIRRSWPMLGRSATRKKKNLSSVCNVDLLRSLSVFFFSVLSQEEQQTTLLHANCRPFRYS